MQNSFLRKNWIKEAIKTSSLRLGKGFWGEGTTKYNKKGGF